MRSRLIQLFGRADLFMRVWLTLSFVLVTGIGSLLCIAVFLVDVPTWGRLLGMCFALLALAWAALLIAAAFSAPHTRVWKWSQKALPDAAGEEGIVLVVVLGVPAVAVTLLLRALGIKGMVTNQHSERP